MSDELVAELCKATHLSVDSRGAVFGLSSGTGSLQALCTSGNCHTVVLRQVLYDADESAR